MPVDPKNHRDVYEYVNRLAPVSSESWEEVCKILQERTFERKAQFAKTGRREYHFGIVLNGVFRAYIVTEKGKEYTKTFFTPIHFKTPISYIGAYTSLVTGEINQVGIEALTDAQLLMGQYSDWEALIKSNKEIAEWSRKQAQLFFTGKEQREFEQQTLQADQRYQLFKDQFPELESLISQYHIAQFLGITATQLSRIRKKINS